MNKCGQRKLRLKVIFNQMRGGPVFIVKPKYIFKHPFNKYDLTNPTNRETQNQQLTDYFNYGFNEDTMNIYGKLVKRFIEVIDIHKHLHYFDQPSELMRLNDQIPMDFGGFNKFHDPWIVDNETSQNFHDGENLMKYFVMMIFATASSSRKVQYPLIEFISQMYHQDDQQDTSNSLFQILEQIGSNLEAKYQTTMQKIIDKANQHKQPRPQDSRQQNRRHQNRDRPHHDKEVKKEHQHVEKHEDPSSDSSSESQAKASTSKHKRDRNNASESSRHDRKKEKKRSKERDLRKKERKEKKEKKSKKVKKEKSHRRSHSKDKKKRYH